MLFIELVVVTYKSFAYLYPYPISVTQYPLKEPCIRENQSKSVMSQNHHLCPKVHLEKPICSLPFTSEEVINRRELRRFFFAIMIFPIVYLP